MNKSKRIKLAVIMIIITLFTMICGSRVFAAYDYYTESNKKNSDPDYLLSMDAVNNVISNIGESAIYTGPGTNDWVNVCLKHTNVTCWDPHSANEGRGMKVLGLMTINPSGKNPAQSRLYYEKGGKFQNGCSFNAAQMGYEAYFCGKDDTGTNSQRVSDWQSYMYGRAGNEYGMIASFQAFGVGNFDILNYYTSGQKVSGSFGTTMESNARKYAEWAYKVSTEGSGKSIEKEEETVTGAKIEGTKLGPFRFKTYITDKSDYVESYYGEEASTQYEIKLSSVTVNGKTYTGTIEGAPDDLKQWDGTQDFYVEVPGLSLSDKEKASAQVKFEADFYTYYGRITVIASAIGKSQTRLILEGARLKQHEEVTFEINGEPEPGKAPPPAENPVIVIEKKDATNEARMDNVVLTTTIDDGYTVTAEASESDYIEIDFNILVTADKEVQSELQDSDLNNAGKLFDPTFECQLELSDVEEFVKGEVESAVTSKVTGSPTYKTWKALVTLCATTKCEHGHTHCNGQGDKEIMKEDEDGNMVRNRSVDFRRASYCRTLS